MADETQAVQAPQTGDAKPKPVKWWQWILVYPAVIGTVATAAAPVTDKVATAVTNALRSKGQPAIASLSDGKTQAAAWQRNPDCDTSTHAWVPTAAGIKVDTTICPRTGDVLIQVLTQEHRPFFRWIVVQDQVAQQQAFDDRSGGRGLAALLAREYSAAAAIPRVNDALYRPGQAGPNAVFQRAQSQVLCQKQIDARTLLRRISTPSGCVDQTIDTYSGQVIRQTSAPCTPQC